MTDVRRLRDIAQHHWERIRAASTLDQRRSTVFKAIGGSGNIAFIKPAATGFS
jgi:hypothetical protein